MSGRDGATAAALLRGVAACAEPLYAGLMRLRNGLYNRRILPVHDLGRPTISVGNLTTGGTGKTPVVCWLAGRLMELSYRPAILLRGYRTTLSGISDEQAFLRSRLPGITVLANPNRVDGAKKSLRDDPQTNVFLLDDAMQHRRAARNVDVVLINAIEPFGYGHVFPRGLLREPLAGLRRASAILITHAGEIPAVALETLKQKLAALGSAPIFACDHVLGEFAVGKEVRPLTDLPNVRYAAACGIGNPQSFFAALAKLGGPPVVAKAFDDHHDFSLADIKPLLNDVDALVVTEKDWAKISRLPDIDSWSNKIWRAKLGLKFWGDDEAKLLGEIQRRLGK